MEDGSLIQAGTNAPVKPKAAKRKAQRLVQMSLTGTGPRVNWRVAATADLQ